jgi:hypothetical protein
MNPQIPTPAPTRTPIDRIPFLPLLGLQQEPAPLGHCNLLPAAHGGVGIASPGLSIDVDRVRDPPWCWPGWLPRHAGAATPGSPWATPEQKMAFF